MFRVCSKAYKTATLYLCTEMRTKIYSIYGKKLFLNQYSSEETVIGQESVESVLGEKESVEKDWENRQVLRWGVRVRESWTHGW